MGSDTEQPGHLIYITDGRLVMNDLQVRWFFNELSSKWRNISGNSDHKGSNFSPFSSLETQLLNGMTL